MNETEALFSAVEHGDLASVQAMLAAAPGLVFARDAMGATPLHHAAFHGHRAVVQLLLAAGADVNARDTTHDATPAGWAIHSLRESGALLAVEIEDALFAIHRRDADLLARLILRHPALAHASDRDGKALSAYAAAAGPELDRLFQGAAMPVPNAPIAVEGRDVSRTTLPPRSILVVTGASGAGKTAAVQALGARSLPGVRCFQFDEIGVPTPEAMERDYGGGDQWQAMATRQWLARLASLGEDVRVAVLDAQTRPSTVFAAPGAGTTWTAHVVLFDCASDVRAARLRGPRGQPELATERMDNWAAYLRGQADALNLPIVDTTRLTVAEAADRLEDVVRELGGSQAPRA